MDSDRAYTLLILRRMTRKMVPWTRGIYNPMTAQPEELRFQILDKYEKQTGQFEYTKFDVRLVSPSEATLTTPWGAAEVRHKKRKTTVLLNGQELSQVSWSHLKRKMDMAFPNGLILTFREFRGWKLDLRCEDEFRAVRVLEERGTLPEERAQNSFRLTKEDIKKLPRKDRPTSIESADYVQYRITASGMLQVKQEDLVRAICVFASYICLVGEIPSG